MATIQGVDYSFDHPTPAQLKAAGKKFAVRYVYPYSQNPGSKNLTKGEADALKKAGIEVVSNYESWAARAGEGFNAGTQDAKAADRQHKACGGPNQRPIYFSVDFDTSSGDYGKIDTYFKGVGSVIGVARTGVYGEYDICKHLIDKGLIGKSDSSGKFYAWQTYAWSAGRYDERCTIAQDKNGVKLGDGTVDLDSAHCADYGQWGYQKPMKPDTILKPAKTVRMNLMHISMQYSDTKAQQISDTHRIFTRAANRKVWWVTGTEANQLEDSEVFRKGAEANGYRFIHKGGDVWVAIRADRIAGSVDSSFTLVIPGVAGRHPNVGVLRATFTPKDRLGQITILVSHYVLPDDPNKKLAQKIGQLAKSYGKGNGLVFYGGDQNMKLRQVDSFYGEPLTTAWEELKHYDYTHDHQTIDAIATYDPDTRTKAISCAAKNDAEFALNTDHFLVEATYDVRKLKK